ncbi:tyrosine-type recombinase/integrase [Bartonella sp. DGB2]|uniref:tyrosine-type recombinase/integrase n=1 Tax=Bartonella sp. DGB2 TaxID=3388426 RepID=UPI00398FDFF2
MVKKRGKSWLADVRDKSGKRHRPTFKTELEATTWEHNARLAVSLGLALPTAPALKKTRKSYLAPNSLRVLGNLFEFVCRTEWSTKRSAVMLILHGRHICEHFGYQKDIAEISASDITAMKMKFASQKSSASTINTKLSALSKMLKVALDHEVISKLPRFTWNPIVKTRFRYLEDHEDAKILEYFQNNNLPLMHDFTALLLDTGARCVSEMLRVKWKDFGEGFESVTFWHTKTNRPRTIPLTSRSRAILERLSSSKGKRSRPFEDLTEKQARIEWRRMCDNLQLLDVTFHTLRHTCCTRLVKRGADIRRVMEWMGHTSINTTMRYMQLKPSALKDIVHLLEVA